MSRRPSVGPSRPSLAPSMPTRVRAGFAPVFALAAKKAKKTKASAAKPGAAKGKAVAEGAAARHRGVAAPALAPARPVGPRIRAEGNSPAVTAFEKALERFRKQDWKATASELKSAIERFPDEPEVRERMGSYMRICERMMAAAPPAPKAPLAHYDTGLLRLNAGELDAAIDHLRKASEDAELGGAAHYAIACAQALKGDHEACFRSLRKAITIDPVNRIHAAQDSDFERVRDDAEFATLVAPSAKG